MNDYENNLGNSAENGTSGTENVNTESVNAAPLNSESNSGAEESKAVNEEASAESEQSAETPCGTNQNEKNEAPNGYTSYSDVGSSRDGRQNAGGYPYGSQGTAQSGTGNGYPYGANGNPQNGGYYNGQYGAQGNGAYNNGHYGYSQGNPYPYSHANGANGGYAYPPQNGNGAKKASKKGRTAFIIVAAILLVGAIIGFIALLGDSSTPDVSTPTDNKGIDNVGEINTDSTPSRSDSDMSDGKALSASAVFKKVKDSSVGILVYSGSSLASEGSGVIFTEDSDGKYTYIITCAHVISDSGVSIMVQLSNEKEYKAQVVGYDTVTDIGVLRIEASGLQKAEIGDSSALVVGETVYAIGNPGGVEFANSFTNGMVSAIDRPVSSSKTGYTMECIQHTAAINPGNSGGALVNEYGQLIGINSMKIVSDEYEGMGFSVPSSVFVKVVNEIISNGYVTNRPKLGITYVAASTQQTYAMYAAIKGLPAGTIIVYSISDDSSFKNTDVQKGDMITAVNGKELETTSVLSEVIEKSNVGDEITLTIVRLDVQNNYSAKTFDVTVKLVENRGDTYATEENTTASQNDIFGNGGSSGSDNYDAFRDYFDRYFGGNSGR